MEKISPQKLPFTQLPACKMPAPNFTIKSTQPVSAAFTKIGIVDFNAATDFIRQLRYGRNTNKANLLTVFADNCGTCSTKHALLQQLAIENGMVALQLWIGIFEMNDSNTPTIATILSTHQLSFIPEAHCYLTYQNEILDYTSPKPIEFMPYLLEQRAIEPLQIATDKVLYHQQFITQWLTANPHIKLSVAKLWQVREACIAALSATSTPR